MLDEHFSITDFREGVLYIDARGTFSIEYVQKGRTIFLHPTYQIVGTNLRRLLSSDEEEVMYRRAKNHLERDLLKGCLPWIPGIAVDMLPGKIGPIDPIVLDEGEEP